MKKTIKAWAVIGKTGNIPENGDTPPFMLVFKHNFKAKLAALHYEQIVPVTITYEIHKNK